MKNGFAGTRFGGEVLTCPPNANVAALSQAPLSCIHQMKAVVAAITPNADAKGGERTLE